MSTETANMAERLADFGWNGIGRGHYHRASEWDRFTDRAVWKIVRGDDPLFPGDRTTHSIRSGVRQAARIRGFQAMTHMPDEDTIIFQWKKDGE
jgi:hypothetical protein